MANYKNSNIYYNKTKSYQDTLASTKSLKNQKQEEGDTAVKNSIISGAASGLAAGASTGAAVGSWAGAVAFGVIGGLIGAAFGHASGSNERKAIMDQFYSGIQQNVITNTEYARQKQVSRNDLITESQYFVNSSKANFISTYGQGSFNMLEATITSLLDMNTTTRGIERASSLIGNLQRDSIVGQIETRLMNQDYIGTTDADGNFIKDGNQGGLDREQIEALNTAYVDVSDLGSAYVEYLYNSIVNSDTEFGDQAKAISDSEKMQIDQLDNNMKSLVISNQQKFAELFLNQRSSNLSNAQTLGETEAGSGASGIRASKYSRTSVNAARLSQDIANASYAIMINSYQKQLENNIESGILSREQVYYSSRQQIKSLERQIKASVNQSINTFIHGNAANIKNIATGETDTDEYIGAAEADKEFLQSEGKSVDTSTQYIYSTHSATV